MKKLRKRMNKNTWKGKITFWRKTRNWKIYSENRRLSWLTEKMKTSS